MKEELLTKQEQALLDKLALWFMEFKTIFGNEVEGDIVEAVHDIHSLQRMILKQAAARAYPEKYRLLGCNVKKKDYVYKDNIIQFTPKQIESEEDDDENPRSAV